MGRQRGKTAGHCLVWSVAALAGLAWRPAPAADVPANQPPWQRLLQGADVRQAERLDRDQAYSYAAGNWEGCLKAAQALAELRARRQGGDHWQAISARWHAEAIRRVLRQPPEAQAEYDRLLSLSHEATELAAEGRHREAQPLYEKILALRRKVFGEDHPDTGAGYGELARNLDLQLKMADAEPLHRRALEIARKTLGEDHPDTAAGYMGLAANLTLQGRYAEAQPLCRKALDIIRNVLGERDAATGLGYFTLAYNLDEQGLYAEAEVLYQKTLAIWRKTIGEEHPRTAQVYCRLAGTLEARGRYADAQPLLQHALVICRKSLGEQHPDTAQCYLGLAANLASCGRHAEAQPLRQNAVDISRKALGDRHVLTGQCYGALASSLSAQGRYSEAQLLYQKALEIGRTALGEQHPIMAAAYNNVAQMLQARGRYAEAQPLYQKALEINRKTLGEWHPTTAISYSNLAANLEAQGRYAESGAPFENALKIRRKSLGEHHRDTAISYNNIATRLSAEARYAEAQPLFERALDIFRKALGERHGDTATCYRSAAANLYFQGRYAEAESLWRRAADSFAIARLRLAASGLGRAGKTAADSPLDALAAVLARNGKPEEAWRRYEESLGRGAWDDLATRLRWPAAEQAKQSELAYRLDRLDQLIEKALAAPAPAPEHERRVKELLGQRLEAHDALVALGRRLEQRYGPVAGQVFERQVIQAALPADAALVGWIDLGGKPKSADPNGEHWAVVLRSAGPPVWERLRGTGVGGAWSEADRAMPGRLRATLAGARPDWRALADGVRQQRLAPLAEHLAAGRGLPAVRKLVVLPSRAMAGVPLEAFAAGFTVSYAPSGTLYAHLRKEPAAATSGLLAVADPAFERPAHPPPPPLPAGGVLLTAVLPGGAAAEAGLRAGDVLLRYAETELAGPADLKPLPDAAGADARVPAAVWREGTTLHRRLRPGQLGVAVAGDPAPVALAERRKTDRLLAATRAGDDGKWPPLPGTRAEAEALRRLFAGGASPPLVLTGSDASEQRLDGLAASGRLAGFRYLHLASHGDLDDRFPLRSAVILARDRLPDPDKQLLAGLPVYDGRLTAEEVLRRWNLRADLVTLSACETALGRYEGGEGHVGFAQALLLAGSRSVCLSLWKVDDTATALLMERFYQNLLGKRPGLDKPLRKAAALTEAKAWLRGLPRAEAARRVAGLAQGVERAKGRPKQQLLPPVPRAPAPGGEDGDRPYAHPNYWAAFVLIGDPG